mgnify:CR=1 FL=1
MQPVVTLPPYTVNLEYRVPGPKAPAAVHETEAEIFLVVEGAGAAVTGGRLEDERRTNPENLSGSGIAGGQRRAAGAPVADAPGAGDLATVIRHQRVVERGGDAQPAGGGGIGERVEGAEGEAGEGDRGEMRGQVGRGARVD